MQKIVEKKIIIKNDNILLIDLFSSNTELSKQTLKSALDKGCIWLKSGKKINRICRVKKPLKIGQEVFVYYNEKPFLLQHPNLSYCLIKKIVVFGLNPLVSLHRVQNEGLLYTYPLGRKSHKTQQFFGASA